MADKKTYEGGCHCGKVRYKVTMDLGQVVECNCSICSKKGSLLAFAPEGAFEQTSGKDAVTDYQFHKHVIHHLFCSTCGVSSFSHGMKDGKAIYAINARCLDGVEPAMLSVMKFDGRSL